MVLTDAITQQNYQLYEATVLWSSCAASQGAAWEASALFPSVQRRQLLTEQH